MNQSSIAFAITCLQEKGQNLSLSLLKRDNARYIDKDFSCGILLLGYLQGEMNVSCTNVRATVKRCCGRSDPLLSEMDLALQRFPLCASRTPQERQLFGLWPHRISQPLVR